MPTILLKENLNHPTLLLARDAAVPPPGSNLPDVVSLPDSGLGKPVSANLYARNEAGEVTFLGSFLAGQTARIPYPLASGESVRLYLDTMYQSGGSAFRELADAPNVLVTAPSTGETVVEGGVEVQEGGVTVIEG